MFENMVVTDIVNVLTVYSHQGRRCRITERESYALSFCLEGQITYTHKGKSYVSEPNCAIILPKGETYTLYGNKTGFFPVINFHTLDLLCTTPVCIPIKDIAPLVNEFEQLKSHLTFSKNKAKCMSIFYNMIYKLSSLNSKSHVLFPAINYIEENLSSPTLTNSLLAKQCNISEVYFRRLFSEQFKVTPKQFIIDARINKAKEYLSEGAMSVNAIGEKCGFENPYHFSRAFKKRVGVTPSAFMKENRVYKI